MQSIIIIGGGAAGLMTAYELSKHKLPVTVLEASNRLGGRIFTQSIEGFSQPVEAGAEFIHGDLPVTIELLKEAGIPFHAIEGKMFELNNGKFKQEKQFVQGWNKVMHQMKELNEDVTLEKFLHTYFNNDEDDELRSTVKSFAGGFDLADISTASTKALYREWSEEMGTQYRIDGGYKKLIDYLQQQCKNNGCIIEINCCAKKISWQQNDATILTMCSRLFKGNKVVMTVPLSALQAEKNSGNYIEFEPAIPKHIEAAKNIGYGKVIKIVLEFNEPLHKEMMMHAGFIFTGEEISTWWTQLPEKNNILTGWLGGEKAVSLMHETDETILNKALQSLTNAFAIPPDKLKDNLKASLVVNWQNMPDIHGGYSFNTLHSAEARKILQQPVNDTLYFAGEAMFEGSPCGTVEAALRSAKKVAAHILKTL